MINIVLYIATKDAMNLLLYRCLSFDCYGTLIDWETGLVMALKSILERYGIKVSESELLELYADTETEVEAEPYRLYKDVLREVLVRIGKVLNFQPTAEDQQTFSESVKKWPAFGDSKDALRALQNKYNLIILSNIDDDLFLYSQNTLRVKFDRVFTAQQIRAYKPSEKNFQFLIEHAGVGKKEILHVAQSLFHDIAPAKRLGLSTVWVNRRKGKQGFGATPPSDSQPDLEVPDLKTLARMMLETK